MEDGPHSGSPALKTELRMTAGIGFGQSNHLNASKYLAPTALVAGVATGVYATCAV